MRVGFFCFTSRGEELQKNIVAHIDGDLFRNSMITSIAYANKEDVAQAFLECDAIVFIGACGIAVRLIAPYLKDKLTDPAVIVIDEMSNYVIPIASGHVGGANELSRLIAKKLDAVPVITTATDVNGVFAVDEFAVHNDLEIVNRDNIKKVSAKLLANKPVNMAIADDIVITTNANEVLDDSLLLIMKPIVLGIGCKKGKSFAELDSFVRNSLEELSIDVSRVIGIASIDIKKDEEALVGLAKSIDVPFVTFTAQELQNVTGDFEESAFVERTVGVSDVSARSAKALGRCGNFILKKKKENGMTLSIFEKYKRVTINYETN